MGHLIEILIFYQFIFEISRIKIKTYFDKINNQSNILPTANFTLAGAEQDTYFDPNNKEKDFYQDCYQGDDLY